MKLIKCQFCNQWIIKKDEINLIQWDKDGRSYPEWIYVIYHVLKALLVLKNNNITHNNILNANIVVDGDKIKLIHFNDSINYYIKNKDLYRFIDGFRFKVLPNLVNIVLKYLKENAEYKSLEEMIEEIEINFFVV